VALENKAEFDHGGHHRKTRRTMAGKCDGMHKMRSQLHDGRDATTSDQEKRPGFSGRLSVLLRAHHLPRLTPIR
jgi:hypothetical protein